MSALRALLVAIVVCGCMPRPAPIIGVTPIQTGSFAGAYENAEGSLVLQDAGGGRFTGTFDSRRASGTIDARRDGGRLIGAAKASDGRSFGFVASPIANGIELSFDRAASVRFTRTNRAPPPPVVTPPPTLRPVIVPSTEPAPPPGTTTATGLVFRDELDGWEIRTPESWKYTVRGAAAVFASDGEAGLIVVTFQRGVTAEQLEPGVGPMLAKLGAVQTGAPRAAKTRGGQAVIYELGAFLHDGSEIRARAFAIAGPTGVVSVLGIASPAQLDGLRRRIDELAISARFFNASPNAAMTALGGGWSAADHTLELCSDGSFFDSTIDDRAVPTPTSRFHDAYTTAWTRREVGAGRWNATGTDVEGTLKLLGTRGKVVEHRYTFHKRDVALDGQIFVRRPGARCR